MAIQQLATFQSNSERPSVENPQRLQAGTQKEIHVHAMKPGPMPTVV
jgi:hypothetical protein